MLKHSLKRVYLYKLGVVNLIAKRSVVIISNSGDFDFGNNCKLSVDGDLESSGG